MILPTANSEKSQTLVESLIRTAQYECFIVEISNRKHLSQTVILDLAFQCFPRPCFCTMESMDQHRSTIIFAGGNAWYPIVQTNPYLHIDPCRLTQNHGISIRVIVEIPTILVCACSALESLSVLIVERQSGPVSSKSPATKRSSICAC